MRKRSVEAFLVFVFFALVLIGCSTGTSTTENVSAKEGQFEKSIRAMKDLRELADASAHYPLRYPVGRLCAATEEEDFGCFGTVFFVDSQSFVTVAHVANRAEQIIKLAGSVRVELLHLATLDAEGRVPAVPLSRDPTYSSDGLFALYKLPDDVGGTLVGFVSRVLHENTPYTVASPNDLYMGQPFLVVTANEQRKNYGSLVWTSYIFATEYDTFPLNLLSARSWLLVFDSVTEEDASYAKAYDNSTFLVFGGIPGDSGSPIFVLEEKTDHFLLAGLLDTTETALRASRLADFLEEHGIYLSRSK